MLVQTKFFHVTVGSLWEGDIIEPGRFGTILRQFRPGGPYPSPESFSSVMWELTLESARRSINPKLPSRLDCVFACATLADARWFRDTFKKDGQVLEIELIDFATSLHHGCFDTLASYKTNDPYVDFLPRAAHRYWTEKPEGISEAVIGGPVRVLGPAE